MKIIISENAEHVKEKMDVFPHYYYKTYNKNVVDVYAIADL